MRVRVAPAVVAGTLSVAVLAGSVAATAATAVPGTVWRAGLAMHRSGSATMLLTLARPADAVAVQVRGDQCAGAPLVRVQVDRRVVRTWRVTSRRWQTLVQRGSWAAGRHRLRVSFPNDLVLPHRCDRNLYVRQVVLRYAPADANPFLGSVGYVDPDSAAAQAARTADPTTAALLDKIASHPQADWIGDWDATSSVASVVHDRIAQETSAGALPVLVLYAIPGRDCSGLSAGGLTGAGAYAAWVDQVAVGVGDAKAVAVLEPDALASLDCLSASAQTDREQMLAAAVDRLGTQPRLSVYLDAGHAGWQTVAVMAQRLRAAGVAHARGFSLDVSNFDATSSEQTYGDAIVAALGGSAHFVVDTSRNGQGSNGAWCNPDGRGLGVPWTTTTGDSGNDALLWIKRPGESDGTCNGGPAAGTFWSSYAAGLAARAAF